MGQLRKDSVLNNWVIIAAERGKRPHQFKQEVVSKKVDVCYFCAGNEHMTPPEIMRFSDNGNWKMRVFPNKFPAVKEEGDYEVKLHYPYVHSDNFGKHEVVVETADHEKELADLPVEDYVELFRIFNERIQDIERLSGIEYVQVFKNHGAEAGTSVVHSHCQIIATNKIPYWVEKKLDATYASKGHCPYCEVLSKEKESERKAFENDTFIAICPYASMFPFEVLILPKRHKRDLDSLDHDERFDFGDILKKVLVKLKELNAPYNLWIHYAPRGKDMHLQLIVAPRLAKWAGFEFSGTVINSVSPESAAKWYRGEE